MEGVCRLTEKHVKLSRSHIYPKFAVEYMKQTGSRFLRTYAKPNQRMQDSFKPHLLGEQAESMFSKREKWFKENVFIPYLENGQLSFPYDENLYYFSISFLWRILAVQLNHKNVKKIKDYDILQRAFTSWRLFLCQSIYPINFDRILIFLTDRVESHNLDLPGVDYYMTRTLDSTIVTNEDESFIGVYGKFLRFIFWGIVKTPETYDYSEYQIDPLKGSIEVPQIVDNPLIVGFYMNRIEEISRMSQPSMNQQNKIVKEIKKDCKSFFKSDAGEAMFNDFKYTRKGK